MKHRGYKFTIWDIGGRKLLRRYWQNYYDNTDVLIWVVDASDYSRLKTCRTLSWHPVSLTLEADAEPRQVAPFRPPIAYVTGAACGPPLALAPSPGAGGSILTLPVPLTFSRASSASCGEELHKLLKEEQLFGASVFIFANKQDIPTALPAEELEKALRIGSITKRRCRMVDCSAVDSSGLLEGFNFIIRDISSRVYFFS
ncbi:hypothetical protein PLESTF_000814000 [Pleodorina starrii]|nr:hypothetical protein PLESTF_000814000 [Pleodorina starrii]